MVYESDFYTTRRPYSRPTVTSYSVTLRAQNSSPERGGPTDSLSDAVNPPKTFVMRREVPWHLVPTVPRPSQVPPCYTAYGCSGYPVSREGAVSVATTGTRPERRHRRILYTTLY
ncbi:hypothetical protein RUM44_001270 [Polyplax serrata]|uniref:Uncharacterized protein n=1 Tax=Polyplax serrata TaxID=468196 RepID=A0ABR1AJI4_POLSC